MALGIKSMRKKSYKNLILPILFLLCGCVYTTDVVKVDYIPSNCPNITYPAKTIMVKKLKDIRGGDPYLISQKEGIVKYSGKYISDKEISEVVTNAIRNLLSNMNISIDSADAELTLNGEILKFETYDIDRFWSSKVAGNTQVNLKLIDNKNNAIIWNEVFVGYAEKGGFIISTAAIPGFHKEVCEKMLDDLIKNIANSPTFKSAVKKVSTNNQSNTINLLTPKKTASKVGFHTSSVNHQLFSSHGSDDL
jgi:hypothetical protein